LSVHIQEIFVECYDSI